MIANWEKGKLMKWNVNGKLIYRKLPDGKLIKWQVDEMANQ